MWNGGLPEPAPHAIRIRNGVRLFKSEEKRVEKAPVLRPRGRPPPASLPRARPKTGLTEDPVSGKSVGMERTPISSATASRYGDWAPPGGRGEFGVRGGSGFAGALWKGLRKPERHGTAQEA